MFPSSKISTRSSSVTSPYATDTSASLSVSPKFEERRVDTCPLDGPIRTSAATSLLDAFNVSSALNFGAFAGGGVDKLQSKQLYSPFHRSSAPHLLTSLAKELTPRDYLLSSSFLEPSQQSALFPSTPHLHQAHLQMSLSPYADNGSTRPLSPSLLSPDRMAAVSSMRTASSPYHTSSLSQSEEANKFLSMQPNTVPSSSSSATSMHPHLSPALSAHYESSYRLAERRMHELQTWKSVYGGGQSSGLETESESTTSVHYLNPPPAHHNTSSSSTGRYLSPSASYVPPSPMVASSPYLLSSLSSGSSAMHSIAPESGTGRKYTRRSNLTNRIPQAVKETNEYKVKRERNNVAVRKSREKAKRRLKENESRAHELIMDNEVLRNRVKLLSKMHHGLRVLLNSFGVSQEKINFEISKSISDSEPEPSCHNPESIFARTSASVTSTQGFAQSAGGSSHEYQQQQHQ